MNRTRVGYIRVNTFDKDTAQQLNSVVLNKGFLNHVSKKAMEHPQLTILLEFVREEGVG
jgi:hypothetical protein